MLTTPAQVKNVGNLPDSIDDIILDIHIVNASIDVKKILTVEKYNEIENLQHSDEGFVTCSIAEACLAFSIALPSLNVVTQGTGILKIKGWDASRSEISDYGEVEKLQECFRKRAMDLLKPFIPLADSADGLPPDEIKGADYMMAAL